MAETAPPILPAPIPLADAGNARRLLMLFGEHIRFVDEWDTWVVWSGTHWKRDRNNLQLLEMAEATVNSMIREAASLKDKGDKQALIDHALRCLNATRLREMVFLARTGAKVSADQFDKDMLLLNCANGTLDLRTMSLRPHDPADLLTRCLEVEYQPEAICPTWERFLADILPSPEVRAYVQKAIGYSLTGLTKEQCVFFMSGGGQNGKSKFITTIKKLFACYVEKAAIETFMENPGRRGGNASPDVAALRGARMVIGSEVDKGQVFNESRLKDMTGEEEISCRELYSAQFSYLPQYKIWLYGNHKPVIKSQDRGIRRRMRVIPFTVTIPDEKKDENLGEKLERELVGILAWCVRGCAAWQKERLIPPPEIVKATGKYLDSMDYLAPFFSAYCYMAGDARVSRRRLWEAYKEWSAGEDELVYETQNRFSKEIADRFDWEQSKDGNGERYWVGVGLLSDKPPVEETPMPDTSSLQDSGQTEQFIDPLGDEPTNCYVCGSEDLYAYTADGRPYCEVHKPVEESPIIPSDATQNERISRPDVTPVRRFPGVYVLRRNWKEMEGEAPRLDDLNEGQRQRWFSRPGGALPPEEVQRSAWHALRVGIAKRFPGCHLLKTPVETALALIEHTLPRTKENQAFEYPPLAPDLAAIIRQFSTQHRVEAYQPGKTKAEQVLLYDARVAHAKYLRDVPVAWDVWHDEEPSYLQKGEPSFRKGFYKVDFSVPADWAHIGLVPVPGKGYPNTPKSDYVAWLNWREVALLQQHNWPFEIKERILFALDGERGSDPLRTFSDKMRESLEALEKLEQTPPVKAVRAGLRAIVLHSIGNFARTGKENPVKYARLADVPEDAPLDLQRDEDGGYIAKMPSGLSKYQARWYHPEWASEIWAGTRTHTTLRALQLPYKDVYAIDGDGLYIGCDPTVYSSESWADDGKIGTYRLQQLWKPEKPYVLPVRDMQIAWFRELKKGGK